MLWGILNSPFVATTPSSLPCLMPEHILCSPPTKPTNTKQQSLAVSNKTPLYHFSDGALKGLNETLVASKH
jgi:hypothetical protein